MFGWLKKKNIGWTDLFAVAGVVAAAVFTGPVGLAIGTVIGVAAKVAQSPADYKPTPENIESLTAEAKRLAALVEAARRK